MLISVDIDDAARIALANKREEFPKRLQQLTFDNTNAVRNGMMDTTPVVTGFNKNSHVAQVVSWDLGLAYSDAPYYPYIIKGRGPIVARNAKALRFKPNIKGSYLGVGFGGRGGYIFRKSVGPAKANDYRPRAIARAKPEIQKNTADFAKWATS